MSPTLSQLKSIHTLGLAFTPDPAISFPPPGARSPQETYAEKTRGVAEKITDSVPSLRRIELRWHGWKIKEGESNRWEPVPERSLMRIPNVFIHTDSLRELRSWCVLPVNVVSEIH